MCAFYHGLFKRPRLGPAAQLNLSHVNGLALVLSVSSVLHYHYCTNGNATFFESYCTHILYAYAVGLYCIMPNKDTNSLIDRDIGSCSWRGKLVLVLPLPTLVHSFDFLIMTDGESRGAPRQPAVDEDQEQHTHAHGHSDEQTRVVRGELLIVRITLGGVGAACSHP